MDVDSSSMKGLSNETRRVRLSVNTEARSVSNASSGSPSDHMAKTPPGWRRRARRTSPSLVDQPAPSVVHELARDGDEAALVPVDDRFERFDDVDRTHPGISEHLGGGVAEAETAHDDIEGAVVGLGEGEGGQGSLGRREQARHEELVAELHLEHVDVEHWLAPPSEADVAHRGRPLLEDLEVDAHGQPSEAAGLTSGGSGELVWRCRRNRSVSQWGHR